MGLNSAHFTCVFNLEGSDMKKSSCFEGDNEITYRVGPDKALRGRVWWKVCAVVLGLYRRSRGILWVLFLAAWPPALILCPF